MFLFIFTTIFHLDVNHVPEIMETPFLPANVAWSEVGVAAA